MRAWPHRTRNAIRIKIRVNWSEREDLNLRPLVSQTSALTGLRHAPPRHPVALIRARRKKVRRFIQPPCGARVGPMHPATSRRFSAPPETEPDLNARSERYINTSVR